jgi:Holliday junction resolvase RusA-like endonuclease
MRTLLTLSVETEPRPRPALISNKGSAGVRYNPDQKPSYDRMKAVVRGAALAHLPEDWIPVSGAVEIRIVFERQPLKGDPDRVWKVTRPDTENLIKGTIDALTGVVFDDDDVAVVLLVAEVYGDADRITLQVNDISDEMRGYAWSAVRLRRDGSGEVIGSSV